jgi:hypothetical protein
MAVDESARVRPRGSAPQCTQQVQHQLDLREGFASRRWRASAAGVRYGGLPVYMPSLFGRDGAVPAVDEREDLTVLAYRFEGDRHCRAQRFAADQQALGPRFVARVLPDGAANPVTPPFFDRVVASPHSVVTAHLIDEAGQPTRAARDEILGFFARRLGQAECASPTNGVSHPSR